VAAPALDGRVRRGERSREAIVAALFELIGKGVLAPTGRQVADAAGVGIRSVFRHFSEMESLYQSVDSRLQGEALRVLAGARSAGSLDERVTALVRQRTAFFERIAPYKRAGNLQRWRSEFLQRRHRDLQRVLRDDLHARLPELARAPRDLREAADLVTSFEAWDRMRADRGLGPKAAASVVARALRGLLATGSRTRRARR
jgi:AcrR family transcriptional regulator